jgi:K+:H+ antiporter subunit KhtU
MAVYLPIVGAVVAGKDAADTATTIAVALVAVSVILVVALRWGQRLSRLLSPASDEALLLAVFGLTLLVGGLAEEVQVSAAIGAFLIGLALSGPVQARASAVVGPLRDLFAATFFLFFSFSVDPGDLGHVLLPATALAVVGVAGKLLAGWWAARPLAAAPGRLRAGTVLIARGEFSIVIAALGASTADGAELGAMASAYVLMTAMIGPLLARFSDRLGLAVGIGRDGAIAGR